MKNIFKPFLLSLLCIPLFTMCGEKAVDDINYEVLDNIDISINPIGVVELPSDLGEILTTRFSKYTKLIAPNGKPIHIFAQSGVSDMQVRRAREILKYHLTDAPGTQYGSDKAAIANAMGNNRATLIYTDTEENAFGMYRPLEKTQLQLQDLYATESPVEGSGNYINNRGGRDAAYEEIFHLVHGKGLKEALPEYDKEIIDATKAAADAEMYFYPGEGAPYEYIITGFDIYFGLWMHDPQGDGHSFGDEYIYNTAEGMKEGDPTLYNLVEKFWPAWLTYNAFIDPGFQGIFSLELNKSQEYTFKSQHLIQASLTGVNLSGLKGNKQDNILSGNNSDNTFEGDGGNDTIEGADGNDLAIYKGSRTEYIIELTEDGLTVSDKETERDGNDILRSIEVLRFSDIEINVSDLKYEI